MPRNQLSPEEQKAPAFVLGGMMILAAAIIIARQLFPFFLIGFVLLILGFVVSLIIEIFSRDHEPTGWYEYVTLWVLGFAVLFGLGTGATYFVGYGIEGTSFGQASLEVYYAMTGAEQEISDTFQQAISQIVEEGCSTLPEESCNLLKQTAESAETVQEVADMAEKLKGASDIAHVAIR